MKEAMESMLGPADGPIGRAFDLMGIAEEEIRAAGGRKGNRAWDAFAQLEPGFLRRYSDELYRAHCRELIGRAKRGEDMNPGTAAEIVACLSELSLKAPPARDHAALYHRTFAKLFPDHPVAKDRIDSGSYPGALDELEVGIRKKLARDRRPK